MASVKNKAASIQIWIVTLVRNLWKLSLHFVVEFLWSWSETGEINVDQRHSRQSSCLGGSQLVEPPEPVLVSARGKRRHASWLQIVFIIHHHPLSKDHRNCCLPLAGPHITPMKKKTWQRIPITITNYFLGCCCCLWWYCWYWWQCCWWWCW